MTLASVARAFACALVLTLLPAAALAQTVSPPAATSAAGATQPDPDLVVDPGQPDFTLSALPTTLRMPAGKFTFRLTHRFARPIAAGSVGDFFADFFGFDGAARIGLELRYGVRPGTQVAVHRTNDRSIQLLGQHEFLRQDRTRPVTVHGLVALDGANNFSEDFSATLGGIVARQFGERGAIYAQPLFVGNADPRPGTVADGNNALLLGLGARARLGASRAYLVVEVAPRLAGHTAGVDHVSVAIEKRYGGHVFQFNVSNTLATSMRQLARGGPRSGDWFVGFNLTRRFF